ncbi:MAG: hypothetical protein WC329_04370 [Candidatus Omnitrophota bacterium]|jgi:hypothetical protein
MFFLFKPFAWIGKGVYHVFAGGVSKGVSAMKSYLIAKLVGVLLGMFSPELLKKFIDMFLDFVENFVLGTKSELDDALVLPICDMIRKTLDIPDDDAPAQTKKPI